MGSFFVAIKQSHLAIPVLSISLCHWFWLWACTMLMRGCWSVPLVFSHSSHTVLFQTNTDFFCCCCCFPETSFAFIVLDCFIFRQQKEKFPFHLKHPSIQRESCYRYVNASLPVGKMLSTRWLAWRIGGNQWILLVWTGFWHYLMQHPNWQIDRLQVRQVSKFTDNTKLGGLSDALDWCAVFQKEQNRGEKWSVKDQ